MIPVIPLQAMSYEQSDRWQFARSSLLQATADCPYGSRQPQGGHDPAGCFSRLLI
jgi:hypothetical protein